MREGTTRRGYLRKFGALVGVGAASRVEREDSIKNDWTAADLLAPESAFPSDFIKLTKQDSVPSFETVADSAVPFDVTDTACCSYWRGGRRTDPQWVLGMSAAVADRPVAQETVETVAADVYDTYAAEYNADLPTSLSFEYTSVKQASWPWSPKQFRGELRGPPVLGFPSELSQPFTDLFLTCGIDDVVFAFTAFGPSDGSPSPESLFNHVISYQLSFYRKVTGRVGADSRLGPS